MYTFARVSIMNTQTGGFKQQIYFLTVGGYKSEIKVSADWAPLRTNLLLVSSHVLPFVQISSSYMDTSDIGSGPTLMTSF